MTAISKASPPSLLDSCIYKVFSVPAIKPNSGFLKQSRFFRSLRRILNEMVPRISKSILRANSFQELTYFNEEYLNSIATHGILVIAFICNYFQNLQAEIIRIMEFGLLNKFLEALMSLKPNIMGPYFQRIPPDMKTFVKCLEHICKSPALPMILGLFCEPSQIQKLFIQDLRFNFLRDTEVTIMGVFCLQQSKMIAGDLEYVPKFPGKPEVLDTLHQQMPFDMKLRQKDLEQLKLPETLVFKSCPENELTSSDSYHQNNNLKFIRKLPGKREDLDSFFKKFEFKMKLLAKYSEKVQMIIETKISQNRMKSLSICYSCEEKISKKKFFDERRFGILNKCDCLICYGCLRKVARTSGVVMGPINCPSCSVQSDVVAANARWIEGKEKLQFFELLQKNCVPQIKSDKQELSLLPNPIGFNKPETVLKRYLRSLAIISANGSLIRAKEKLESSDLLQVQEALNSKLDLTQRRDLPESLDLIDSGKPEAVKVPLTSPLKLDTVAVNVGWIDGYEKLESVDLLGKREASKIKLDRTVCIARNDYFSTRVPVMGLVN